MIGINQETMRSNMEEFVQLFARIVLTGVMLFLASVFLWQGIRLWIQHSLVLAPFDYAQDGQPSPANGEQFARMVRAELIQLADLYNVGQTTNPHAIPRSQNDPAVPIDIPAEFSTTFIEQVELKAYGIEFGAIFKTLRRKIESPREITGTVTKQGNQFSVFAELKSDDEIARRWNVSNSADLTEATRNVACRIFRHIAAAQSRTGSEGAMLKDVSDDEFCFFTHALVTYEQYRQRKPFLAADAAAKLITQAGTTLSHMLASGDVQFPYVHKLAALVFFEERSYDRAETAIDTYSRWLEKNPQNKDRTAEIALVTNLKNQMTKARLQTFEATRKAQPLRPGVFASLVDNRENTGMICCIVKDALNKRYILLSRESMGEQPDVKIIQPAAQYGGDNSDIVATYTRSTTTVVMAEISVQDVTPRILMLGTITDVVGNLDRIEDAPVFTVGKDGSKIEGKVESILMEGLPMESGGVTNGAILVSGIENNFVSGAPVITATNELVGMVLGAYQNFVLVIPMQPTLAELEVELVR